MTGSTSRRASTSVSPRGLALRAGAAVTAAVLAGALATTPALADDIAVKGTPLSMSGMSRDTSSDVYWVVKSPTSSEITSITADGQVADPVTLASKVTNVQALSWREGVLYVGDIGGERDTVTVHAVSDPGSGSEVTETFTLRYPDGPHDSAAMMVSPRGNIYLVTTGSSPAFYRPSSTPVNGGEVSLRRVAAAPAGVSDGTFLSDGQQLAVRTPVGVALYDSFSFQRTALGPTPDQIVGDALTESLDGGQLVVGYGGAQPRASVMPYPTGSVTSSPKPSATPTPTPSKATPSTSASSVAPSAPSTEPPSITQGSRGTLFALGVAALIALAAGAVTLIGRRN